MRTKLGNSGDHGSACLEAALLLETAVTVVFRIAQCAVRAAGKSS